MKAYKIPNRKTRVRYLCENCGNKIEGKTKYCQTSRLCIRCFGIKKREHIKEWKK